MSSLEPGDVIVQHFVIEPSETVQALHLGVYDPATGQRQATTQGADHILIQP